MKFSRIIFFIFFIVIIFMFFWIAGFLDREKFGSPEDNRLCLKWDDNITKCLKWDVSVSSEKGGG